MKVSIDKPYWNEPIEDEVEEVTVREVTTIKGNKLTHVIVKGGKNLGDGEIVDDQLTVTVYLREEDLR